MAIARGAGTETLRSHIFNAVNGTQKLIIGEQHHIYTVLSITIYTIALNASTDTCGVRFVCWEGHAGTTVGEPVLFKANPQVGETYIWNDKFSFNGFEPTGVSGQYGAGNDAADIAYHNAIADQGGSVVQSLEAFVTSTSDNYSITVTFIDQNNA